MISGAGASPAAVASRSACRPAQITSRDSVCAPPGVSISTRSSLTRRTRVTGVPRCSSPPLLIRSSPNDSRDCSVVDDGRGRRQQRGHARDVRLKLAQFRAGKPPHARHAVGLRAPLKLAELDRLRLVPRDHELAPLVVDEAALRRSRRAAARRRAWSSVPWPSRARSRSRRARPRSCVRSGGWRPRLPSRRPDRHPGRGELPGDREPDDPRPDDADRFRRPARAVPCAVCCHGTGSTTWVGGYHANLTAAVLIRV